MTDAPLFVPLPQDLVPTEANPEAVRIGSLLSLAIEKGLSVEGLEKLVALHERVMDRSAAQEFAQAMAQFQEECPPIRKTTTATITTKSGGQYQYTYAELDEIARTVRPHLHKHGLSYSWDSACDDKMVSATCVVQHVNGHSRRAGFSAPVDTLAQMSGAQKYASALSFAKRQTLIQVLGV